MVKFKYYYLIWSLAGSLATTCTGCGEGLGQVDPVQTTLSGTAYLSGPVTDASVSVFGYPDGEKSKLFAMGVTDSQGEFLIDLGSRYGDLLISVDSGAVELTRVALGLESGDQVDGLVVSPFTTMTTSLSEYFLAALEVDGLALSHELAANLINTHFGGLDHESLVPLSPVTHDVELNPTLTAGLLLQGLWFQARHMDLSSGPAEYLDLLLTDLSADGVFDGQGVLGSLQLGPIPLSGDTLRPEYARYLYGYLDSPESPSQVASKDLLDLLGAIENSTSRLFPGRPGSMDFQNPSISFGAPMPNSHVSGRIPVEVHVEDDSQVTDLYPLDPLGFVGSFAQNDWVGTLESSLFPDGPNPLTFEAVDRFGNLGSASLQVHFSNAGTLNGIVFKGPVAGAHIDAYAFDLAQPELVTQGTAGSDGVFALGLKSHQGPVLLQAYSGSYEEEAFDAQVALTNGDALEAVVPAFGPEFTRPATISPLTTWAASLARFFVEEENYSPGDAATEANNILSEHFDLSSVLQVQPMNLTGNPSTCDSLSEEVRYALLLAGLSRMAYQWSMEAGLTPGAAISSMTLSNAIAEDFSDGLLDGHGPNGSIEIEGTSLTSYALRAELARAVGGFLASPENPCDLTPADFRSYGEALAAADSGLFPLDEPPIPVDVLPPVLVIESHESGQAVREVVRIEVLGTDEDELLDLSIAHPEALMQMATANILDVTSRRLSLTLETKNLPDGTFSVLFRATDRTGNQTEKGLDLVVDNTPPTLTWTAPAEDLIGATLFEFAGLASDAGSGIAAVLFDGREADVLDGAWAHYWGYNNGSHELTVAAFNLAGNETSLTRTIRMDTFDPTCTLVPVDWTSDRQFYPCGATDCDPGAFDLLIDEALFDGAPPVFEKIVNRLGYSSPDSLAGNNLPFLAFVCTDGEDLPPPEVTYRHRVVGQGASAWSPVDIEPVEGATHLLPISTLLGPAISDCAPADLHRIEIRAVDEAGNVQMRNFEFHLRLIPEPLVIQPDEAYATRTSDPHNLWAVKLEDCDGDVPDPFLDLICSNQAYEELFFPYDTHEQGLRIARTRIVNPGTRQVRLQVPEGLLDELVVIHRLLAERLIAWQIWTLEDEERSDCFLGEDLACELTAECTSISDCGLESTRVLPSGVMHPRVILVQDGSSAIIEPDNGGFTLSPGAGYYLYTVIDPLPSTFHQYPKVIFQFSKVRHQYRGIEPVIEWDNMMIPVRRERIGQWHLIAEYYLKLPDWEQGFNFEHDAEYDLQVGLASQAGTVGDPFAVVPATLTPLHQQVEGELMNPSNILGQLGTGPTVEWNTHQP